MFNINENIRPITGVYEKYLKGTKAKYKITNGNNYELVSEGKRGNDIVLTIDIRLQKYLEEIIYFFQYIFM